MSKIPIRIITDANDRNPTQPIDRRFPMAADWVIADSSCVAGVLPISLAEFQAASANFMLGTAGEAPAAWYQFNNGITVTGSGVSQWSDQSGNGRHLLQGTDANRPARQSDGSILFNGTSHVLACNAFTFNAPETVYVLFKQVTWTNADTIFDGNFGGVGNTGRLLQNSATPTIAAYCGGANIINSTDAAVGSYVAAAVVFNGASSLIQVGNSVTAGTVGAANMGGFTLGADPGGASGWANIQVKEAILFPSAHSLATRSRVIAYLGAL